MALVFKEVVRLTQGGCNLASLPALFRGFHGSERFKDSTGIELILSETGFLI